MPLKGQKSIFNPCAEYTFLVLYVRALVEELEATFAGGRLRNLGGGQEQRETEDDVRAHAIIKESGLSEYTA